MKAGDASATWTAQAASRGYACPPPLRWHPLQPRVRPTEPPMTGILWGTPHCVYAVFRKKPAPTKGFAGIP